MIEEHSDFIPYPQSGLLKFIFRLPLLLHHIGLGWVLSPAHLLVLTVRGRKSGKARHTVLEYRRHGSKLYIISAWGERPQWFKNMQADPQVTVQFGVQERAARAQRVDDPAEALRALYMFQRTSPLYEAILAGLSSAEDINLRTLKQVYGEFTIVRLDLQQDAPPLPGIQPRHGWVGWALILSVIAALLWLFSRQHTTQTDRKSVV